MAVRNWIADWRRRRRAVRSYLRSRAYHTSVSASQVEEENEAPPARALEKLPTREARMRRIAVWRRLRPVTRWHRRTRIGVVIGVYFGTLGALSLLLCLYFLQGATPQRGNVPTPGTSGPVSLSLGASARIPLQEPSLKPGDVAALQQEAESAFRRGDFPTAEKLFLRILPKARLKALTGFYIYLCLLQEGKAAELELLAGKIPSAALANNPFPFYSKAASALKAGHPAEAVEQIASARRQFPEISLYYDKALREAGLPVPEP